MGGAVGGMIDSVAEGVEALGGSVKHAIEGDWEEAGKDFARVGLEAAGIAGNVLGGGQIAEVIQEGVEGMLDNAVLERGKGTGDVPAPGGKGADWSIPNLLSGAAEGVLGSLGGAMGAGGAAGALGGAGGSLGKIIGAVTGEGGAGGAGGIGDALQGLLGDFMGGGQGGGLQSLIGDLGSFGQAAGLMGNLEGAAGDVAGKLLSSVL